MFRDPTCSTFRKILIASVFGVGVCLIPHGVQSATSNSATLQWAANQESDLAGYRVYHGTTTGSYGPSQDAGKTTTYQFTNLESNKTHYFSVAAYDTVGNESFPSLEVSKTIITVGANRPVITPPTVGNVTKNTQLAVPGVSVTDADGNLTYMNVHSGIIAANSHGFVNLDTTGTTITYSDVKSTGYRSITLMGTEAQLKTAYATLQYTPDLDYVGSDELVFIATDATGLNATTVAPVVVNIPDSLLSLSITGEGTVTSSPAGVSCSSGTCSGTFPQGSSVTLTAAPSSGSTFSGWSGACTGTSSCVVALSTSSASVSANFASSPPPSSSLSVTLAGGGSGIVTGGVACSSGTCSGTFSQGSNVTLTASPKSGSIFSGWGGACTGTGSCVVALSSSSASVSATFATIQTVSRSLSVSVTGDGNGSVTSSPSGLICSGGTCNASFPQGTTVTLTPTMPSGNVFQGWNGVCSGTSNCAVTLSSSQVVTATFASENSEPPLPKPNLPILVNFQPTASQVPTNFKKDDGSVFTSTRGYGWNKLLKGTEQNSTADQTLDTFVSVTNLNPGTWSFAIPNGIYYVTMVLGDPKNAQGPHWVSAEGLQLAKQVATGIGEYLTIVDYPVEVKDSTLSLTLGNSGQGQTTLNYLAINEKPNLSNTTQTLTQSFGTTLVTSVLNPGEATKINPVVLVKNDKDEKELKEKAVAQKIQEQEAAAVAQAQVKKQREQEAAARAQDRMEKEQEVAKLNEIKEKMSAIRESGGTVSLRNLFSR